MTDYPRENEEHFEMVLETININYSNRAGITCPFFISETK